MRFPMLSKIGWAGLSLVVGLAAGLLLATQTGAQQRGIINRSWTCHVTIQLQGGTNPVYAPASWTMSGTIATDRAYACRIYAMEHWLNQGQIWGLLNLSPAAQHTVCTLGSGSFEYRYGFDERGRAWAHLQTVAAPPCNCPMSCPAGYNMDYTGRRCDRSLCTNVSHPNQNFIDASNNGVFIWSGTLYQMVPAVQSGGACTFR